MKGRTPSLPQPPSQFNWDRNGKPVTQAVTTPRLRDLDTGWSRRLEQKVKAQVSYARLLRHVNR